MERMKSFSDNKRMFLGDLAVVLCIIALALFLQFKYMDEFPVYYHAWAQDDRYALALGFIDNGFDLFHPQTMIYNKQFPGEWMTASDNTITSVDFPIHEFVVALLMKLTGSTSPWVFRCWTMICSLIGLFFLYRAALLLTESRIKSLLVMVFALCSPVYAFYFNGFLPGIPAFAFGTIGLFLYFKYLRTNQIINFYWCIGFLTLSTLIRTTFAIELIAVLGFEFLRIIRKESVVKGKVAPVMLSACAIGAYLLWNGHLRSQYGTLFLSDLMPPESFDDAKEILQEAKDTWQYHYLQKLQYIVFLAVAIIAIALVLGNKLKKAPSETTASHPLSLWWLAVIYLFGCLLFTVAMMQQLPQHDYYFIDSFFLPILLVFTLTLKSIPLPKPQWALGLCGLLAIGLCVQMLTEASHTQQERRSGYDMASICHNDFIGSDHFLDSLGVSREAKIVALYAYPQNGPFIQMGRKGYTVMWHKEPLIHAIETWDFDYIVIENYIVNTYFEERKGPLSRLQRIADNGKIALCTLADSTVCYSLSDFYK